MFSIYSNLDSWESAINQLVLILRNIADCSGSPLPSVHIGLLGALSLILQYVRQTKLAHVDENCLASLVPKVCRLIQQSTRQIPHPPRQYTATARTRNTATSAQQPVGQQQAATVMSMGLSYSDQLQAKTEGLGSHQIADSSSLLSSNDVSADLQKENEVKLKVRIFYKHCSLGQ